MKKAANSSTLLYIADAIEGHSREEGKVQGEGGYAYYLRAKSQALGLGSVLNSSHFWNPHFKSLRFMTVVRDPLSRTLSAFLQKREALQNRQITYWEKFPGFSHEDEQTGFSLFVDYLDKSGPFGNAHWQPQVSLLIWPPSKFDYVLKVEELDEGLNQVFSDTWSGWARRSFQDPHKAEQGTKVTDSSQRVRDFYTAKLRSTVERIYSEDFTALGYRSGHKGA